MVLMTLMVLMVLVGLLAAELLLAHESAVILC
jgi:hypothetical protein